MDYLYRVSQAGETFHALECDGRLRRARLSNGSIFGGFTAGPDVPGGLSGVRLHAPVQPSKIVCLGQNYSDHAREMGKPIPAEPMLFIKPSTAVVGPGSAIVLPPGVGRVDYEGELGVVIGRRAHRVAASKAWDYVLGLVCVNDVTARELQTKDVQYTRAKGFDTFAPIGPAVALGATPGPRTVETFVNGARRQASDTSQLAVGIEALIEFITFVMTLEPGDIISTGTPSGIGPLVHRDIVSVKVQGVGELTNPVRAEGRGSDTDQGPSSKGGTS
jgi:2-keto-4-pentenoate hydratase/2-oxohepta-3-ene-1,7-dioic acid hydratase in catechol pathway